MYYFSIQSLTLSQSALYLHIRDLAKLWIKTIFQLSKLKDNFPPSLSVQQLQDMRFLLKVLKNFWFGKGGSLFIFFKWPQIIWYSCFKYVVSNSSPLECGMDLDLILRKKNVGEVMRYDFQDYIINDIVASHMFSLELFALRETSCPVVKTLSCPWRSPDDEEL